MSDILEDIQKLKKGIRLNPAAKAHIRERLLRVVQADIASHRGWLRFEHSSRHTLQRSSSRLGLIFNKMPAVVIIAILALVGGGTSVAAQSALPGQPLYPVKISLNEKVGGAFFVGDKAQADWEIHLADVRLEEAEKLSAENKVNVAMKKEVEDRFESHVDRAMARIGELRAQGKLMTAAEAAADLELVIKRHQAILAEVSLGNSKNAKASSTAEIDVSAESARSAKLREDLELAVKSRGDNGSEAGTAAEGKIRAADNVLAEARAFVGRMQISMSSSTRAEMQQQVGSSQSLLTQAKAKFQAGSYNEAFVLAQQSLRAAEGVKDFVGEDAEGSGEAGESEVRGISSEESTHANLRGEVKGGASSSDGIELDIEERGRLDL